MDGNIIQLPPFDFKNPDYIPILRERARRLMKIRREPELLPGLRVYYKEHIADFINDWGMTFDPRNPERGLPASMPFVLFPRQREWIDWLVAKWKAQEPGITEKSRDCGVSWLAVSAASSLCLFYEGIVIGFGSRKQEYVDKIAEPRSLFFKARMFIEQLPQEFRGGWERDRDSPLMRIGFPATGSHIGGESGDDIGRGDRTSIYMVDESAYLERPKLVDAALSMTTNCRIDVSSVNGLANSFAERRHSGKIDVFIFDWRDDPRKDDAWYAKMCAELDPVVVAQEIDRNYAASVEGVLIPQPWALAAIDAHVKLGIPITGTLSGALDVADQGYDKNAWAAGRGVVLERLEEWSGQGGDIFGTVERAFRMSDENVLDSFRYDGDGLGAGVRGDARVINERRVAQGLRKIRPVAFRGSESVYKPEGQDVKGRKNKDYFQNRAVQSWWNLRERFRRTYRWVRFVETRGVEGEPCDPDEIISISGTLKLKLQLVSELSQSTFGTNGAGKMFVEKAPDGMKSPNLADAVRIKFAKMEAPMVITTEMLERV